LIIDFSNDLAIANYFYIIFYFGNSIFESVANSISTTSPLGTELTIIIPVLLHTINPVFFCMKIFIAQFESYVL
jgi:hypothetical protein